jgi:hypothetical protein
VKLFHFYRIEDHSGVSGTGPVVEGVEFTNGWCAIRWLSKTASLCFYQSLDEVKAIHGHGGKTEIIVHDFEPVRKVRRGASETRFEAFMLLIEAAARLNNLAEDPDSTPEQKKASIREVRELLEELEQHLGLESGRQSA